MRIKPVTLEMSDSFLNCSINMPIIIQVYKMSSSPAFLNDCFTILHSVADESDSFNYVIELEIR